VIQTECLQGHAYLDKDERLAAPVTFEAFLDLLEWYACGDENRPGMSPPLSLGWDIRNKFGDQGFATWRDLMMVWEPPFLASELLPGDQRTAVTLDEYEAALVEDWARYARGIRQFDWLIIDAMSHAQQDGWIVSGSEATIHATEATLDDLARRAGAKRAADIAPELALEERQQARAQKCYDLDDAAYARWIAAGEPIGRALKFERWKHRRLRERRRAALDELHAMDLKTQRIHVAEHSTDAECDVASAEHERFLATWHQHNDHLWPELTGATPMPANLHVVPAAPLPKLIKTSAEFMAGYRPPDYLIDGILQRRYIYSITAGTGAGKTSIALRWTGHIVTGRLIGTREVEPGKVLYFAGENPDDVRARWAVLCREMGIDPNTDMVHWVDGAMNLQEAAARLDKELADGGNDYALVVVDTSAAYFPGDNENDNTQAGNHARHLRSLTKIPGGPCTLILCHPPKNAGDDMQPRGGGAFIAEMDGNIAVYKKDMLCVCVPYVKFRGDNSWTMHFELEVIRDHPILRDTKGRATTSVLARPVAETAAAVAEARNDMDSIAVLRVVCDGPVAGSTPTDIAKALRWTYGKQSEPNRKRVNAKLAGLAGDKLVKETLGRWKATSAGQKSINDVEMTKPEQAANPMFPMPLPPMPPRQS